MATELLVGTRKGFFRYKKDGPKWALAGEPAHLGIPVAYAWKDTRPGGFYWACLDHGHWGQKLSRSPDGVTWEEAACPSYPEGELVWNPFAGKDVTEPAKLRYLWVMAGGGQDEPGKLYLGTEPGGLFVSLDQGANWELNRGLWDHPSRSKWSGGGRDRAGIHSILVDPNDSRHVFIGISCAGVFETVDGGETWAARNQGLSAEFLPDPNQDVGHDPHFVAACATDFQVLYQQNHCGIYKSVDSARTWAKISQDCGPAHFGFAVAVAEDNPKRAWVVPAQADACRVAVDGALCVCRTDDGGATWQAFRDGLPQNHVYDIVFRHGLDADGADVAFGSTTGNLFFSGDHGASWSALSQHLPPIYSIRFTH
jgi:hypothetical protein